MICLRLKLILTFVAKVLNAIVPHRYLYPLSTFSGPKAAAATRNPFVRRLLDG